MDDCWLKGISQYCEYRRVLSVILFFMLAVFTHYLPYLGALLSLSWFVSSSDSWALYVVSSSDDPLSSWDLFTLLVRTFLSIFTFFFRLCEVLTAADKGASSSDDEWTAGWAWLVFSLSLSVGWWKKYTFYGVFVLHVHTKNCPLHLQQCIKCNALWSLASKSRAAEWWNFPYLVWETESRFSHLYCLDTFLHFSHCGYKTSLWSRILVPLPKCLVSF